MTKPTLTPPLPTLDVVIPCYNEHDSIKACFEKLLTQRDDISRVIVVDNNSSDDSADIIKTYAEKYPEFFTYLFEPKQGAQYARSKGLDAATADILARIDIDTHIQPGWAKAIRTAYANDEKLQAASGVVDYYDLPFRAATGAMTWVFIFATNALVTRSNSLYGCNMTIRKSAWETAKKDIIMYSGIMEDTAISLALNQHNLHIGHVRGAYASVSGRRLRSSPLSFWKYNRMWWNTYRMAGFPLRAMGIRVIVWVGNVIQAICWVGLLFHDPVSRKWKIGRQRKDSNHNRILP